MIDTAIILAGGKGERLRPLTNDRPKVMVEVAGKPIIEHQIDWLKQYGITKFIVAVSYKYEVIQDYLGDGSKLGVQIDYSVEETPLGRGGGIKKAMQSDLAKDAEAVVVANGDIITKVDISEMIKIHLDQNAIATLLLIPYVSRYGLAKLDADDHILGFEEKPRLPYWVNGGIYVFSNELTPMLPDEGDHEILTFPKIDKKRFIGFKAESFWRAVDVIKDRNEAEQFLDTGKTDFS